MYNNPLKAPLPEKHYPSQEYELWILYKKQSVFYFWPKLSKSKLMIDFIITEIWKRIWDKKISASVCQSGRGPTKPHFSASWALMTIIVIFQAWQLTVDCCKSIMASHDAIHGQIHCDWSHLRYHWRRPLMRFTFILAGTSSLFHWCILLFTKLCMPSFILYFDCSKGVSMSFDPQISMYTQTLVC